MKRALIIAAIILLIAAVVGIVLLGGLMMNNYAETGSVFGSSPDISGGFWDKLFGKNEPEPPGDDKLKDVDTSKLNFKTNNDGSITVVIDKNLPTEDILVIPSEYAGKPVTEIKLDHDNVILDYTNPTNTSIKKIVIPDSVQKIGTYAFYAFSQLEEVVVGNSVVIIDESAFGYCDNLKSVTLGDSVHSIYNGAFANCSNLKA